MALPTELLATALARVPPRRRLVLGVSGGVDSMLLLALVREQAAGGLPVSVLHVDHGLHPQAGDWAAFVARHCAAAGIPCTTLRVRVDPARPSREAAAREARYAAFAGALQPGDALLLAHHADDQAETLLLRLVRGTGLSGLGGMRPARPLPGVADAWLVRPLLGVTRAQVLAEAMRRGLAWVTDPANEDAAYDRNLVRHEVLPRLVARWPSATGQLAAAARRLAEADDLLQAYLDAELAPALAASPWAPGPTLAVAALPAADPPRARALLRRWLARAGAPSFTEAWLDEALAIAGARMDAEGSLRVGGWELHRHRGRLYVFPQLAPVDPGQGWAWSGAGELSLGPAHGVLSAGPAGGLALALPPGADLRVSLRRGGERITPAGGAGSRPLKKVLQDLGLPAWLRDRIPLLHAGDRLVAVGDLVADASAAPRDGRSATLHLHWRPPTPVAPR